MFSYFPPGSAPGTKRGGKKRTTFSSRRIIPASFALREGAVVEATEDGKKKKNLLVKCSQRSFPLVFEPRKPHRVFFLEIYSFIDEAPKAKRKNVSILLCPAPFIYLFFSRSDTQRIANDSRWIVSSRGCIGAHNNAAQCHRYYEWKVGGCHTLSSRCFLILLSREKTFCVSYRRWWIRPLIAFYTLGGDERRIPDKQ